jgi:hypothetical protein
MKLHDIVADTLFNTSIHTFSLSNMRKEAALTWTDREREYEERDNDPLFLRNRGTRLRFKRLEVRECNLPKNILMHLLVACDELEGLVYEHPGSRPEFCFDAEVFGGYIAHLQLTLRELEVYQPMERGSDGLLISGSETDIPTTFCYLAAFSNLQTLCISAHLLVRFSEKREDESLTIHLNDGSSARLSDLLPPSLETLKMLDCEISVIAPAILELLDRKSEFAHLRLITLMIEKRKSSNAMSVEDVGYPDDASEILEGEEIPNLGIEKEQETSKDQAKTRLEEQLKEELQIAAWENDVKLNLVEC